jgi:WD40 repeat protein
VVQTLGTGSLNGMAVSRDGWIATSSSDGALRLWDPTRRALMRVIRVPVLQSAGPLDGAAPSALSWDADGHRLAASNATSGITVDFAGKALGRFSIGGNLLPLTWKGASGWLVVGTFAVGGATWTDGRRQVIIPFQPNADFNQMAHVALSGDGSTLAFIDSDLMGRVGIVPLRFAATIREVKRPTQDSASALALSADGRRALIATGTLSEDDSAAWLINVAANDQAVKLGTFAGKATTAALSSDGRYAVVAGETIVVWDVASHRELWRRRAPALTYAQRQPTPVASLAFGPRSDWLAAGDSRSVMLFDTASGRLLGELGDMGTAASFMAPSLWLHGDQLIADLHGVLMKWSLRMGCLLRRDPLSKAEVLSRLDDHDLALLRVVRDKDQKGFTAFIDRWSGLDLGATDPVACDDGKEGPLEPHRVFSDQPIVIRTDSREARVQDFHAGARRILYNARDDIERQDSHLMVRQIATGKDLPLADSHAALWARFSPHGRWVLASTSLATFGPQSVVVWDAASGKQQGRFGRTDPTQLWPLNPRGRPQPQGSATISDDDERIAVPLPGGVGVWRLADGRQLADIPVDQAISAVAFSPGDPAFVLVGTSNGELHQYRDGRLMWKGSADGGAVRSIAESLDGKRVATVSADGAIRIWQGNTLLAALATFDDGEFLAFSPGGAYRGSLEGASRVAWVFDDPFEMFWFAQFERSYARADIIEKRLAGKPDEIALQPTRPPRVEVLNAPRTSDTPSLAVRVHVDGAARIDRLLTFVEGRPVGAPVPICARTADKEVPVQLQAGLNHVQFVAVDEAGFASNAAGADIRRPGSAAAKLWVVAAGVRRYPKLEGFPELTAADRDPERILNALRGQVGGDGPFSDLDAQRQPLINEAATASAIEASLERLTQMGPDDVAIVFLSGHGYRDHDHMVFLASGAEAHHGAPTSDTLLNRALDWKRVGALLRKCRGRVLMLLDACNSGAFSGFAVPNRDLALSLAEEQHAGVIVFASSKGRELSREMSGAVKGVGTGKTAAPVPVAGNAGIGVFTSAIVAALASAESDRDGDQFISVSELIDAVIATVAHTTDWQQTPWVARREMFGDFRIGRVR